MKAFIRDLKQSQKGFTLIELLVVVAILGVLSAVAVPNVSNFIGAGDEAAQGAELHNVQLAVTAAMFDNNLTSVAANATATNDMTTDLDAGTGTVPISDYLLQTTSQYWYSWTTEGRVSQSTTAPGS